MRELQVETRENLAIAVREVVSTFLDLSALLGQALLGQGFGAELL